MMHEGVGMPQGRFPLLVPFMALASNGPGDAGEMPFLRPPITMLKNEWWDGMTSVFIYLAKSK